MKPMYEYHGWVSLVASPTADDEGDEVSQATLNEVRQLLAESKCAAYLADERAMNVAHIVTVGGFPNHAGSTDVLDVFERIAKLAPGSYGLLHVHDDEAGSSYSPTGDHHPDDNNAWFTYVMRRGTVTRERDHYLSPHIPKVEDPDQAP